MRVIKPFPGRRLNRAFRALAASGALLGLAACGGGGDEPTAPPPAATTGTLTVTADQATCGTTTWSAEVFINGASQGRKQLGPFNPLAIVLTAGSYNVSVTLTDGVRTFIGAPVPTQVNVNQSVNRIVVCV
jgi:hypothetical protein